VKGVKTRKRLKIEQVFPRLEKDLAEYRRKGFEIVGKEYKEEDKVCENP